MKRLSAMGLALVACAAFDGNAVQQMETNMVVEISFQSQKSHDNPFIDVELNVVFSAPDGTEMKVPAFWKVYRYSFVARPPPSLLLLLFLMMSDVRRTD